MRRLTFVTSMVLVGCASSGTTSTGSGPQETVRISGGAGLPTMTVDTHPVEGASTSIVGFPLDRVWGVLKATYDSVSIPVATMDVASHTIGNSAMRVRRRLGDVPMSKYVNCGSTQGGSSADTYEIVLAVLTRVQAQDAGTTRVVTSIDAQGRPITLAGEYARCTSTGALEKRIADIVAARLNR